MVPVGPDCVGTGQCSPLRDPVEGWPGREGEVPQVDPALNAGANLAIPDNKNAQNFQVRPSSSSREVHSKLISLPSRILHCNIKSCDQIEDTTKDQRFVLIESL